MRATCKLAAVAAAAALLAVPAVSAGDHRDSYRDYFGGRDLDVVGLTGDGRLISSTRTGPAAPRRRAASAVSRWTPGSWASTTGRPPATTETAETSTASAIAEAYVIEDDSGKAKLRSRSNVALEGTSFGVDFNPTVDRLRVVSDTGQNLRVNVDDGSTLTDGRLAYPGVPPAPATPATGVTGAAYTNNDADPNTATTLYDIDSMLDQTVIQSPANSGLLAPTGKLTVDTSPTVGFDIYSTIRDGSTVRVQGFASLTWADRAASTRSSCSAAAPPRRGASAPVTR